MLLDPVAFKDTIDLFVERYKDKDISVVAGIVTISFIYLLIISFCPFRSSNSKSVLKIRYTPVHMFDFSVIM